MRTRIMRKNIAVLTVIAMIFTLIPSFSFAAEAGSSSDRGTVRKNVSPSYNRVSIAAEDSLEAEAILSIVSADFREKMEKINGGIMGKKHTEGLSGSLLEEMKQSYLEMFEEGMSYYMRPKASYCSVIWTEIQNTYNDVVTKVSAARTFSEVYTAAAVQEGRLELLMDITKKKVSKGTSAELKKFRKSNLSSLKAVYNKRKKAGTFNNYYSDMLEDSYYTAKQNVSKAKTFGDAAYYKTIAQNKIKKCKTKKELAKYRKNLKKDCKAETQDMLVKKDYTKGDWKIITGEYNRQMKKLDKMQNASDMYELYDSLFYNIFNALPVNDSYRSGLYAKYAGMMEDAYLSYDEDAYSFGGYEKIEDIYYDGEEYMDCALANYAEKKIALRTISKMKKVPDYDAELKALKKSLKKKLSKYIGNKKYIQKKVKPVVKAGKAAIDKAKTIPKANKAFAKYRKKAEAAVKKFRIKSSAGKGGSITASRTVKYGANATFVIKADKGYSLSELKVDGKNVKKVKKYTFKKVKKNHTIKAYFKEK